MSAENALNMMFPTAHVRVTQPVDAPEYSLGRLGGMFGRERAVRRPCPRIDWVANGRRYFCFIAPVTMWRDGREAEDHRRTLETAARIIRAADPTAAKP